MDNELNNIDIDIRPYYALMNACKKFMDELPERKRNPSSSTIKQYRLDVKRMTKTNATPSSIAKTKKTFYKYKAGWTFVYIEYAKKLHQQASQEKDKAEKIRLIIRLEECVKRIKLYPPDYTQKPRALGF